MVREKANAKINLFLNVLGKRLDGYHDMEMVMAPLKLHDVLKFEKTKEDKIEIICDVQITKSIKQNLVYKVAEFIKNEFDITDGVRIYIEKNIPIAGGLAGGSADCAATIRGLNRLFKLGMTLEEMAELGVGFGADVPFCVYSKLALVGGIGEKVQPFNMKFKAYVLLVNPNVPVLTKRVFDNLDSNDFSRKNYADLVYGLKTRNVNLVAGNLYNVMEPTTFRLEPKVKDLKNDLLEHGLKGVLMSGSGSTVFAISNRKNELLKVVEQINDSYFSVITKTI